MNQVVKGLRALCVTLATVAGATSALALAPGQAARGFRDGANHHLGDDSFVARFGRPPGPGDSEALRMHTHLTHVRALLGARPATAPALEPRRAALLAALDDYIAHGATPVNRVLPWRNPVFIDGDGAICAVGYLIERSAGRALAERIAAHHRYDLLEDIAAAEPEVVAWVASSGFTLEELASIQPGYQGPEVDRWQLWTLDESRPHDGPWRLEQDGVVTTGAWRGGQMDGSWTRTRDGQRLGSGSFVRGRGTWRAESPSGVLLATGPVRRSHPDGTWRFFHPSGRVAAEGGFARGHRHGRWRFFHDDDAGTVLAQGRFTRGALSGRWRHFDARGKLLATAWPESPPSWRGEMAFMLRLTPGQTGVTHEVHQGTRAGDWHRLDRVSTDDGHVFFLRWEGDRQALFDSSGRRLEQGEVDWMATGCSWGPALRKLAVRGALSRIHGLLTDADDAEDVDPGDGNKRPRTAASMACGDSPLGPTESAALKRAMAALVAVRAPVPAELLRFIPVDSNADGDPGNDDERNDLTRLLADNMSWYIEWPHIDGRFEEVLATLPDHYPPGDGSQDTLTVEGVLIREQ